MKKYLICGAMALAAGLFITSCTHDDIGYSSLYEEKTQQFDQVFKELYGTIDPNHDWGFKALGDAYDDNTSTATSRAKTRGENVKGNIWYQNWERPVNVTDKEKNEEWLVVQYFKQERGENAITITWDNYWVQQVYKSNNLYTAVDGQNSYNASVQMNHLLCYDHKGWDNYDHSNNFNGGDNTTNYTDQENGYVYVGTTLMEDMGSYSGTTAQFGYHNSVDSKNHFEYFIVAGADIDPSLADYYYVGFDFYCNGNNPNMQVERDHKYDDWIVRISPATRKTNVNPQGNEGQTTTSTRYTADRHKMLCKGRVFVEDLFKATREDLDYNDAVFDAIIWEVVHGTVTVVNGVKNFVRDEDARSRFEVEISLLAAGGTIPLKIADGYFGEVHTMFAKANPTLGINGVTMVNTRGNYSEAFGSYVNGVTPVYKKFDYTDKIGNKASNEITLNDIEVSALWESSGYTAAAILNNGATQFNEDGSIIKQEAPHMLCAYIGTRWATERRNIMEGYRGFRDYVNDEDENYNDVWESYTDESSYYLYEDNPSPLRYGNEDLNFCYYDNIVTEEIIWQNEQGESFNNRYDRFQTNTMSFQVGNKIRIYGSGNNANITLHFVENNDSWRGDAFYNFMPNFQHGYAEFTVTQDMVNNFNNNKRNNWIGIWGNDITITAITVIR